MLIKSLKRLLRPFEPPVIRRLRTRKSTLHIQRTFSSLTLEETFDKIYADNHWGGKYGDFCSGPGSDDGFTQKYCALVRAFITLHHLTRVVDLGCGDFRVGRRICSPSVEYIGVDVVSSLIHHLTRTFGSPVIAFRHLNVVDQTPPAGDLCMIRQVFQHLSNDEITRVLRNVEQYPYVLITEHIPLFPAQANLDISHGPDIRLSRRSGVFLEEPPFSLQVEKVLDVPAGRGEVIRTVLLRQTSSNTEVRGCLNVQAGPHFHPGEG